jgi:RNA recognition motif-containing protein
MSSGGRNRKDAPTYVDRLWSLRIGNLSERCSTEELREIFARFGVIGDLYRPISVGTAFSRPEQKRYAFVRYFSEDDAESAIREMNGYQLYDESLIVEHATQDSFFSNSTGYITNYEINEPPRGELEFDPSMPASHRAKKVEEWARQADKVYTVKVEHLPHGIT